MSEALHLKVVTPVRVAVDAAVDAVSVPAALGVLGVLPGHAPLLASLGIGVLTYRVGDRENRLVVLKGFVEIASNTVTVLADQIELPEEVDVAAARAAIKAGEEAMRTVADEAQAEARESIEAATARLAVAGS